MGKPANTKEPINLFWIKILSRLEINRFIHHKTDHKEEVHEDISYISYDKVLKKFKLRQFHVESFVNEYVAKNISEKDIDFETESIENIPNGFRAKESYKILNSKTFTETFSIAEPGKDFETYSEVTLRKVK